MENNWPETLDELLDECQRLISKYDLYTLGKYGKPFTGETEPRVDGTEYLAGEYQYGVAMIPAQWVRHALSNAELGSGTCKNVAREWEKTSFANAGTSFCCSECGAHYVDAECYYAGLADKDEEQIRTNYCPNCGRKVVSE